MPIMEASISVGALRSALEGVPDTATVVTLCEASGRIEYAHVTYAVFTKVTNGVTFLVIAPDDGFQVIDLPGMSEIEDDDDA